MPAAASGGRVSGAGGAKRPESNPRKLSGIKFARLIPCMSASPPDHGAAVEKVVQARRINAATSARGLDVGIMIV